MLSRRIFLVCASMLAACAGNGTTPAKPASGGFDASQLAKTDIDRVAEAHQREIFLNVKRITEKLYRRNPRKQKLASQDAKPFPLRSSAPRTTVSPYFTKYSTLQLMPLK